MTLNFDKLYESILENYPQGMSKKDMAHVRGDGPYTDEIDWDLDYIIDDLGDSREVALYGNDGRNGYSIIAIESKPYDSGNYEFISDMKWKYSMSDEREE